MNALFKKVHKHIDLQELTLAILNDMVKRVYVHALQKLTVIGRKRLVSIMTW